MGVTSLQCWLSFNLNFPSSAQLKCLLKISNFTILPFISLYSVDDYLHVDVREGRTYPHPIEGTWHIPPSIKIDTGFQKDGVTYFFSGPTFFRYIDKEMKLETMKPRVSSQHWMGCRYTEEEINSIQKSARIQNDTSSTPPSTTVSVFTILFSLLVLLKAF